ncbi:hypothetical protein CJK42_20905 [Salmonella enterica subsp. enterica serovar Newport]|nr:hypothetical protein [Salmonella enterica]EBL7709603.1 hypothetical protein [Salmonella enterica]EBX0087727.1 hypothetical protein [Salmonella enterica subsp. enterica serovar Miami]ECT9564568.1 hypothetical protein [Salmonella enterica subsp. enterica serovar Newport]EDO4476461.1 hypothetical protein [Salmonella enterica]
MVVTAAGEILALSILPTLTAAGIETLQVDATIGTLMATDPEPTGSPEAAIAPALIISPASSNVPATFLPAILFFTKNLP